MMNAEELIHKYYVGQPELESILLTHSNLVAARAMRIAQSNPAFRLDTDFLWEAAMLHDIGIIQTDAPAIQCFGTEPYIRHGLLGAQMLRAEGLPRHARVAERHTGTGLTKEAILEQHLPLPPMDFTPVSMEEKIVCYADKFYSKTRLREEKTPQQALRSLEKFGWGGVEVFRQWLMLFEGIEV